MPSKVAVCVGHTPLCTSEIRPAIELRKVAPSGILDFISASRVSFFYRPPKRSRSKKSASRSCSFTYSPNCGTTDAAERGYNLSDWVARVAANQFRFPTCGPPSPMTIFRGCSIVGRPFSSRKHLCPSDRLLPRCPPSLGASVARVIRRLRGGFFSGVEWGTPRHQRHIALCGFSHRVFVGPVIWVCMLWRKFEKPNRKMEFQPKTESGDVGSLKNHTMNII